MGTPSGVVVMESDDMKQPLMNDLRENQCDNAWFQWTDLWGEAKKQLVIALPIIVMNLIRRSLSLVSLMFVGHLSELALSSTSIGSSITSVTGPSIMMGMAGALETLCGQAFGAKQYRSVGIHMQRAMFILLCLSIPISISWFYMDQILVILGQDTSIAFEAGKYAKYLIPTLFSYAFLFPMLKFLQSQSIIMPMMLCSAITLTVHTFVCWLLILKLGFGIEGAALANNISCWVNVIGITLYILLSPACEMTRAPFSGDALHDIKSFLNLGIPSTVMTCCEWWAFEILVLLSGRLPNPQLETSVLSVCLNTASLAFMVPNGLGAAVSTRVSNALGGGDTKSAKLALHTSLLMAIIDGLIRGTLMICIRNYWGLVYSKEEEVVGYIAVMMPLLAVGTVLDSILGVLAGTARGSGQQKLCAYANLIAYYTVAIPLAVVMAFFTHLRAKGLWIGIVCGVFSQTVMTYLITRCTDWNEQARKARERECFSVLPRIKHETSKDLH